MPLTSVSPDNPQMGQEATANQDNLLKQPPNVPIPNSNPMNTSELGANRIAGATLAGDSAMAQGLAQSRQSSGSSGGGLGGIFGAIGSVIGGLFAGGGIVNAANHNQYAAGGEVEDDNKNNLLATGYLIGALHQSKFGGTPDTLPDAANHIKMMLAENSPQSAQGFAAGGISQNTPDGNLAEQELLQALNINQPAQPQPAGTQQQPPQQGMPQGMQNAMASGNPNPMRGYAQGGQPQPGYMQPTTVPQPTGVPQQQQPQGYAPGGPPMAPQGPPTVQSPNQDAPAEGEIKGPGGPTDDLIPAKLSNGEFVMSAAATQFWGVDKLAQMNDKGKQGFMQKVQQVQDNQQQGPNGAPVQPPGMPPMGMMQPPMQQAQGGTTVTRTRGSGYCGM